MGSESWILLMFIGVYLKSMTLTLLILPFKSGMPQLQSLYHLRLNTTASSI